jgi:hypothetical protein
MTAGAQARGVFTIASTALLGFGLLSTANAQNNWFARLDLQNFISQYLGAATSRDSLGNAGLFLRADYLERGGFTVGYNRTMLDLDDGSDIDQHNAFLSGRLALTPDGLNGRITLRADVYDISNDATEEPDSVTAGTAQVSFLNFAETFYVDLGLTRSAHRGGQTSSGRLDIDQLTPTIGFAFNQQSDWLQIRGYFVDITSTSGANPSDSTSAIELKWTHWLRPNAFLGLDSLRFAVLGGERQYAVDHDAATIFNLAEFQTGTLSVGGEWIFAERNRLMLLAGVEEYESRPGAEAYRGPFLYLDFAHEWP